MIISKKLERKELKSEANEGRGREVKREAKKGKGREQKIKAKKQKEEK